MDAPDDVTVGHHADQPVVARMGMAPKQIKQGEDVRCRRAGIDRSSPTVSIGAAPRPASSHFFFLRFVAVFVGVALSIKKSSSIFPSLIAAFNHLGVAPRPAQVSPSGPRDLRRNLHSLQLAPSDAARNLATKRCDRASQSLQLPFEGGAIAGQRLINLTAQVHQSLEIQSG